MDFEGKNSTSPRSGIKGKCMICVELNFWRASASETALRFHMQPWRTQSIPFSQTRISLESQPAAQRGPQTPVSLSLPEQVLLAQLINVFRTF